MFVLCLLMSLFLNSHAMHIEKSPDIRDMFHAIKQNKIDEVRNLLQRNPELLYCHKKGIYPIHKAAQKGSLQAITCMLAHGVSIDQKTFFGSTPLMSAAHTGNLDIVKYCVEQGANVYHKDYWGHTALGYAIFNGHKRTTKFFLQSAADVTQYFDQKPYYAGRTRDTNNVLTLAAMQGHTKIVKWLLKAGAPVTIEDPYDIRHVQRTVERGYYDIVKILLEHGADVNDYSKIIDPWGNDEDEEPPLISAIHEGNYEMVALLLSYGADTQKAYCGKTPLKIAKQRGNKEIVTLLKQHKYRLNNVLLMTKSDEINNNSNLNVSSDC